MTTTDLPHGAREITSAGVLARHAAPGPTALITFTDEEMLALVTDPEQEGVALPWIDDQEASVDGFSRRQAKLTAMRGLLARGVVAPEAVIADLEKREPDGEPHRLVASALATGIVTRRRLAALTVDVTDLFDDGRGRLALFVDRDGTVLQEQISGQGVHHFVMQDIAVSVDALRAFSTRRNPVQEDSPAAGSAGTIWSGPRHAFLESDEFRAAFSEITACAHLQCRGEQEGELWILTSRRGFALVQPAESDPQMLEAVDLSPADLGRAMLDVLEAGVTDPR